MNRDDDNRPVGGDDDVAPAASAKTVRSSDVTRTPEDSVSPPVKVAEDDVLTVEQTAQLLHVHPKTVRQLFRRRQLPGGRKLGAKVIRFSRAAVLEWLRGNASVSRRSR